MTIASLIVDVAANTANLQRDTAKISSTLDSVAGMATKLAGVLGVAFSVQQVVGFAREIASFASDMVDLSAETGIGVERLQALNYVAAGAGLTVQDLAGAVSQLSRRLASGDDGAINALGRLSLKFWEIRQMAPDQAFIAISKALAGIEDPMERSRIAFELFGKSGSKMLRIMTDDIEGLIGAAEASGAVMDEELIKKADAFDDFWAQSWLKFRGYAASAIGAAASFLGSLSSQDATQNFMNARAGGPVGQTPDQLAARAAVQNAEFLAAQLRTLRPSGVTTGSLFASIAPTEAEIARLTRITDPLQHAVKTTKDMADAAREAAEFIGQETAQLQGLAAEAASLPVFQEQIMSVRQFGRQLPGEIRQITQGAQTLFHAEGSRGGATFAEAIGGGLRTSLGPAILSAIQGGGNVLGSIAGTVGQSITKHFFGGEVFQKGITDTLGKTFGGALNAILPGIGSLLGPAIQGLGKLFGGLFGGEGKKVNDMRDKAFDAAGGFDVLNQRAAEAGLTLDRVLAAKKVKDFEAAMAELNAKLGNFEAERAADALRLDEAIKKYGFSMAELGATLRNQKLHEQAVELIEDWRVLVGSGIDVETVNTRMSEAMSAYLDLAIRTGGEVPVAMRPILQSMVDQGVLLDENGVAITDLGRLNIHWSESMTQGFDRVVTKLQELIDKLQGTGEAIEDIPSQVTVGVDFDVTPPQMPDFGSGFWDVSSLMNRGGPWWEQMPGFAHGTGGQFMDFGAGTPVMLHGRERVMTEREGMSGWFGGSKSTGHDDEVHQEIVAMRRDLRDLPSILQVAMQDAYLLAGAR